MINNEQKLEKLFGGKFNFRLKILRIYLEKGDRYFNNISGLSKNIKISHVTCRKAIRDLIDANILKEIDTGMSKIIMIDREKTQAKRTFKFLNEFLNEEFEKNSIEKTDDEKFW